MTALIRLRLFGSEVFNFGFQIMNAVKNRTDVNDDQPWSQLDIFHLRTHSLHGSSLEDTARFLGRDGTREDVGAKAKELGFSLATKEGAPTVRWSRDFEPAGGQT